MNTKKLLWATSLLLSTMASAESLQVEQFRYVGPFPLRQPVQMDSTDVNAKVYDAKALLDARISLDAVNQGTPWSGIALPGSECQTPSLHLLGCNIQTSDYFKGTLKLDKAPKDYHLYLDGKEASAGDISLRPGSHTFVIKYLSQPEQKDSLQLSLSSDSAAVVPVSRLAVDALVGKNHLLSIEMMQSARRYAALEVSPDGRWILDCVSTAHEDRTDWDYYLWERATGRKVKLSQNSHWLPRTSKFYQIRRTAEGTNLVVVDPATLTEEVWVKDLPSDNFTVFPTEDRLLVSLYQEGPKELNPDAFEFVHPDDRIPSWRNRWNLALYDIKTGVQQQLTFGYNTQWMNDIAPDGKHILLSKSEARLTARPTSLISIYQLDLETLKMDTLVDRDGFISDAQYSPDGKSILLSGSPECLGGVGNSVPEGMTPSMIDRVLYLMNPADRQVKPLTRDFPGMVSNYVWNKVDGQIYFTAEECDSCNLYRLNPQSGRIDLIHQPEEYVGRFNLALNAPVVVFTGESNDHSWHLYHMDLGKKAKPAVCLEDLNGDIYGDASVSSAQAWVCRNSHGDDVHCRYYLPNGFDASAKYPMIVYYYGGCSGTLRSFESHYPWTIWAAQGYVVLVVNPSGATGFGREWAARHVNTAGVDPARDIIEATQAFCNEHSYVNREKLGCIGASYGGFMTQYLQTVTDIFRCAISHAGISDHSNYWGYGYWGYTYSEVSMANSYPWTRKDLYVERSPLYNVDKIKSSMLFLHGTDDTNVPYNNSVQMYTALKLLGKDVAMVSIKGENHGIMKPSRRFLWHNATMAWFARCLKDDPTWWESLYPKRTL